MTSPIEILHPRGLKHLAGHVNALVAGRLWLKVVIGMILGIFVGFIVNPSTGVVSSESAETIGKWVALPGRAFLTLVQMIVVPLVFASVIRGIAANNSIGQLKSTGLKLVAYFLITTIIAALIGIALAVFIQPGTYVDPASVGGKSVATNIEENLGESDAAGININEIPAAIIGILPDNPLSDAVEANMLQVVLFSIVVGLALVTMRPEQSRPLLDLLGSILTVTMTIVRWVMVIAPYAVFGLIAQLVINTGFDAFVGIGVFVATVLLGLALLMAMYMFIAYAFGGWKPWTFMAHVREPQLFAFSTDSSAATIPISLKTVEEKLKVRPSIAQFVVPIGATVNMNATALFQGMTTIFFTQVYGLDLAVGTIAALIVTIIGASIGAPATPGVSIIVLSAVLRSVGIPLEGLALIIGVDQILSRIRGSLNVTGDLTASVVMNRLAPPALPSYSEEVTSERALEEHRERTGEDVVVRPAGFAQSV